MDLISIRFLLFAALTVALYYALPRRLRPYWLLVCSLFFYLCADLRYILFLLFSIATTFLAARALPESLTETAEFIKTAGEAGAMSTRTMVETLHKNADWDETMIQRELTSLTTPPNKL